MIARLPLLALLLAPLPATAAAAEPPRPSLVVMITVDQLRPDYLERWRGQLTGGLARLLDRGAVFTRAYQDHAITETAPGHASVLSGRFPRSTGITMNTLGVEDAEMSLVEASGVGASPRRFRGTALFDWMQAATPASRALSVSMKDRGAILPVGRARQSVFWYASGGIFTTSRYYADTLPTWLQRVNARGMARRLAGQAWTLMLPDSAYAEPDSVPPEGGGRDMTFPHRIPEDTTAAVAYVRATPWMDEITAAVALEGVTAMNLGRGPAPDLLAVSLSGTDVIGHRYGPDSREIHDQVLQLDRILGRFLDSLYALRDPATIAVALTADHGVSPYPERAAADGKDARHVEFEGPMTAIRQWLAGKGADPQAVDLENGVLIAVRSALETAKVDPKELAGRFVKLARAEPGVLRAETLEELAGADTTKDVIARRWLHMFEPGGYALAVVTLTEGSVWGFRPIAEHGSPFDADAHVPLVFLGPWFAPGRHDRFVRTVDIGPTLARVLGVKPDIPVDGRPLPEALR